MKKIVCYGDSNTFGYDPKSFSLRYPEDIRWTGLLRDAGYDVINMGMNGREIPVYEGTMAALIDQLRGFEPIDLLTVMLGSNDLLMNSGFRAEDAAERMDALMDRLRGELPKQRILLISPNPVNEGLWVREKRLKTESRRMAECYRPIAEKYGAYFADSSNWNVGTGSDGVHFTEQGHRNFADGLEKVLTEIFAD